MWKGKVTDCFCFSLGETKISCVTEEQIKSLGKLFTSDLKDTAARQNTGDNPDMWLLAVDKSGLPGEFKAWIYQCGIMPRLFWPLLMYKITITTVEGFERKIGQYLRRYWQCRLGSTTEPKWHCSVWAQHQASASFQQFNIGV